MKTIVDVAALAQVSVSTVSHVINNTRPVAPETRARVEAAISSTGYVQHASARALRRAKTDSIGLVVTDTGQPVFAQMVRGVEAAARAAGFTLLLANSAEDADQEQSAIEVLRERRVDGLILARCAESHSSLMRDLKAAAMPVVLMDRLDSSNVDQVGVENEKAMRAIVEHLVDLGHTSIGIAAGNLRVATLRERYEGFVGGLQDRGLKLNSNHVYTGTGFASETESSLVEILRRPNRPSAVVASSTLMATGTLRAARTLGLTIPQDLAFVTCDALPMADLFSPPLTTIEQPAERIGERAFELLRRRMLAPKGRRSIERLTPTIRHRVSCGCTSAAAGISV